MKRIFTIALFSVFFNLVGVAQITWTKKTGPYGGYIGDIVVHPTNFTVYAVSNQNNNNGGPLYRSTDNGVSWTELGTSVFSGDAGHFVDVLMLANGTIYALSYQCCGGGGGNNLYKSTDDGATWTKLNSGNGSAAGGFDNPTQVAYSSFSGNTYIYVFGRDNGAPFNNRVYRSTDGGTTFSKVYGDLSGAFTNISITSTGDIYAQHFSTLFKSTDQGATFSNVGTPDLFSLAYLTAKSDGSELVMVTTGSTMFSLKSPFTTWNAIGETNITLTEQANYGSQAVMGYSLDNSILYLLDNAHNKIYSGSSAGTWTQQGTTLVNSNGDNGICFAAKDANTLYVGTSDVGIWKTVNSGAGWNESDNGIEAGNYSSVVTADNGNIIVAGTRAQISTDQGATWTRITTIANNGPNYNLFKATTGSPATIVAIAQGTSYKSTNNGATWTTTTNGPSNAYEYASTDGTNIVGWGNSQFFYTHDQGTTWSAALTITGTGWPSGSYSIYGSNSLAVDGATGVIYCYLYDAGYKLFKIQLNSTTAPTSGTAVQINQSNIGVINSVNSITYLNGKLYASWYGNSGPGNVSFSSDGGGTWTTTSGINSGRMDVDPVNNYLFVTGSNGNTNYTINLSRDGGTTFTSSTINTSSNSFFYGINLSASGVAYAGFSNSSIYATTGTVVTPAAPTGLVNSGAGTDRITLRWIDNASNESYFVIKKFNGTGFDSIGYHNSNSPNPSKLYYEVQNLAANTSYTFRVFAANAAGYSSPVSLTTSTLNSCASSVPDNRSWNGSVAWSNSTPASGTSTLTNVTIKSLGNGYYAVTDIANGAISGQSTNISATFFESCNSTYLLPDYPIVSNTDGTWTSGTNTLVLKYITTSGVNPETTATVTLTVNATDPIPAAPSNATAYVYDNTSIEVSWVGSAYETQYIVERSSVDNTFSSIDKTYTVNYPSTSVIDNFSLVSNTIYYYRVKAKNGSGTSATASNTASVQFTRPYFTLSGTTVESTTTYSSTGAIWGDFNNDGFDDLIMPQLTFFAGTATIPTAFKNNGAGNFVVVNPTGIVASSYLVGTAADYDNDGKLDLFLTSIGSQNYLYKGNGDFTFSLVGPTAVSENDHLNGIESGDLGASWADYDNNGLVDLLVVTQDNTLNAKFFTQGPVGTFTKQTTGALPSVMAQSSLSAWADYDNDGDQDVFITDGNSGSANELFKNNGNGTFTRVTGAPFDTDLTANSFTAAWGDYNNDGYLDLFIGGKTNNLLYKNNGNGTFTKQVTGIVATDPTGSNQVFGAAWGDINNDGFQDLLVTIPGIESRIYINNNGTAFTKVITEKFNDVKVGRFGIAFSDYNKDGLLDLASAIIDPALFGGGLVTGPSVKNQLFKNNASSAGNWLEVKLTGSTSNRLGLGTRVTIVAGGKTQIRELASTSAFCSQNSQLIHFGLGASTSVTSVQIKWPSGIVQSLSNVNSNQILNITEDNTGPVASTLSPTNSATGVNANTTLAITLNEQSTATAGKFINLYRTSDLVNVVASIDVSTVTPSGNTFTFTLPQTLLPSTSYSVVIDAGAFKDIYGNPSLAMSAAAWQFTTTTGPVVSLLNPLNNATGVAVNTPIEITFDKAFSGVSGKKINLTIRGNSSPDFSIDVTTGTITSNKISFTPSSSLGFLKIYDVAVDAGAFKDANGNATVAITWSFVTLDNVAPVITFTPPATLDKNFSSTVFAVSVSDNSGTVSSTTLSYRKIAGGAFTDLAGTFDAVGGKWNFTVQESFLDGNGLEFYLSAKDPSNNAGRLPLDPNTNFYTYLNYKAVDNVIPSQQIGFGGTASSWKIFTIPFDLGSGNAISSVLNQLSSLTIQVDWRMLTYKNNTAWGEYPTDFSTFVRGQGYFINIKDPVTLVMPAATASGNNRKNLFQMSLKKGWNQVGNPYLTAISWDDVKNFSGNTGLTGTGAVLKKFSSGSYVNQQSLQPFEGGFVLAENDITISIPFVGQTAPGGRAGSPTFGNGDWIVPFTLTNGEAQNSFGGVGMHTQAVLSYDQFDDVNAPRFINYVEMNFAHPEHFAKNFARDVVPQANEYVWEFTVDSNGKGLTQLTWDNAGIVSKDIFLYDLKRETIVNMKEINSYSFDPKISSTFRVYFGDDLASKIKPQTISLGDAYPNPSSGAAVAIPFTLPEGQSGYQITMEVYNSLGDRVSTLTNGAYPSGFYLAQWEPNQDLTNGLYIYRMKAVGKDGSTVLSKKIVINH